MVPWKEVCYKHGAMVKGMLQTRCQSKQCVVNKQVSHRNSKCLHFEHLANHRPTTSEQQPIADMLTARPAHQPMKQMQFKRDPSPLGGG